LQFETILQPCRDIHRIFVNWDIDADALVLGIDCFGICGDADGDGDPSWACADNDRRLRSSRLGAQ
jgi:hypothetical protein